MLRFLLLIVALIVYGSLYPFKFSGQVPTGSQTYDWFVDIYRHTTRSDIIANILLFVPYGVVVRMTVNQHKNRVTTALWLLLAGVILAYGLQYAQFFLPARVPSAGDAVFNIVGMISGVIFAHWLMQYSHNHMPTGHNIQSSWSQVSLPLLLALIWICWRWFPFVPLVSAQSIVNSLNPLLTAPELNFMIILRDGIGWLLFFYLISQPPFDKQPRFRVLKIATVILSVELFIINNELTVNDLLAALGAFALYASIHLSALQRMLLWGVVLATILTWLAPFNWHEEGRSMNWMPFASLLRGPWENTELVLLKLFLTSATVYLFRNRFLDWGLSTILCSLLIFLVVQVQRYLGAIKPDISDVIVVLMVGWAMYQVEKLATDERTLATQN